MWIMEVTSLVCVYSSVLVLAFFEFGDIAEMFERGCKETTVN
jgi:hypothetical protein